MIQEFNDLSTIMWVSPSNKMNGKFSIYANGDEWLDSFLIGRAVDENSLSGSFTTRAIKNNDLNSTFKLMYKDESTLNGHLLSTSADYLDSFLSVRPHNQMYGLFEILEPPRVTDKVSAIQDSTTRSLNDYKYLNYGKTSQMMVGNKDGDIQRLFIQFDISEYSSPLVVEKAKLRLYYNATFLNENNLRLGLADRVWEEQGITDANRPLINKIITTDYELNTIDKYIEFNVYDIMQDIFNGEINNDGFILESINDTNNLSDTFFTRESHKPPELNITYFDTRVWTATKSELKGSLFTIARDSNDLAGHFQLHTDYAHNDLSGTLWIHRYDTPEYDYNKGYLSINTPDLNSFITVYLLDDNFMDGYFKIQQYGNNYLDTKLTINIPELNGSLFVKYYDDLASHLHIRAYDYRDLNTVISISNPELNGTFISRSYGDNDLNGILRIEQGEESSLNSQLYINTPELNGKLITKVHESNDLNSILRIRRNEIDELHGSFSINKPELNGTLIAEVASSIVGTLYVQNPDLDSVIVIRAYDEYDLNGYFRPKVMGIADLNSYIRVINKSKEKTYFYIL